MKTHRNLAFLFGFAAIFLPPLYPQRAREKEKVTITNPFWTTAGSVILEISPLPQFVFSFSETLRIRKTEKAEMYEYKSDKPGKPYRHLTLYLELLGQETKTKFPKADVVAVTRKELQDIMEVDGIAWMEPLSDESAKQRDGALVWFAEEDVFQIFLTSFKDPARVLILEQFLAHLVLMVEWEASVRKISPDDTEIFLERRKEEWKKQEGKAYALFHRVSGHWKLLQLNWPPELPRRPKILSVPLPWPPWPLPRNKK